MQPFKLEDPCFGRATDIAELEARMFDVNDQKPEMKFGARQHPDPGCTPHLHAKPPPHSEDQTFNVTESAGINSFHQNHADFPGKSHPAQDGAINQGEYEAKIKHLSEELDQCQKQCEINATQAQARELELENEQAKFSALLKEFNKAKVHSQSHMIHHVTDGELSEKVQQLRYNISSFAIQHFEDDSPIVQSSIESFQPKTHDFLSSLKHFGFKSNAFSNLMQSHPFRRSEAAEALIWATLCETLFEKFAWTSDKTSDAIKQTKEYLHPENNVLSKEDRPQALRRWHTWRATTSIALLEALAAEVGAGQDRHNDFCDTVIKSLEEIVKPFIGIEDNTFTTELRQILEEAIELDKVMNKQVPALTWICSLDQLPDEYFPNQMEFNLEYTSEMPKKNDWLILNPGLKKTGKSTGQDFDQVTFLFKTKLVDNLGAVATE